MSKLSSVFFFLLLLVCMPNIRAADQQEAVMEPIEVLDPSFAQYIVESAEVEKLAEGNRVGEGPVWIGDMRCLLWTDIPNNRIMKWDEETGMVSIFKKPADFPNGLGLDRYGRLIACEHSRRVTRTEYDGSITVLADSYDGKKLNSPNDVAVKSDDSIWFTDPPFGIMGHYLGHKAEKEQPHHGVYRIDGATREVTLVCDDLIIPNGIAFSPDERTLYVVDSIGRAIYAFDVINGVSLINKRVFTDVSPAIIDGAKVDADGNVWVGWGGPGVANGVAVFNPSGKKIGFINTPERISNLVFGGEKKNRLFMTGGKSVFSLYVEAQGDAPKFAK